MLRLMTFLDETAGTELTLPVSPQSYRWQVHKTVETVSLDQLGEINLAGGRRMGQAVLSDCLFPAQAYPFCAPGAAADPWYYLERLERWAESGTVVQWMVSGTPLNVPVLVESVEYGERDGTNDVYADITLRQYRLPKTAVLSAAGSVQAAARPSGTGAAAAKAHTVSKGDTLWALAEKYYGDGKLCYRLAAANPAVKNPDLIYPGQVLTVPAWDALPAAVAIPKAAQAARETQSVWKDGKWRLEL